MARISRIIYTVALPVLLGLAASAHAGDSPKSTDKTPQYTPALSAGATGAKPDTPSQEVEVTADQSLEWYQDQHMYIARGHAIAIRGDMQVEADLLSAHEREPPPGAGASASGGQPGEKAAKAPKPPKPPKPAPGSSNAANNGSGDLDKLIAEGHVIITDPRERIQGDRAVDDLDKHISVVTGNNLRYETEKEIVTARDSLEYWDEKKIAVARGHAVAVGSDRHVEGDVLTAEFRDNPSGQQELWKMTADGNVTVITKTDVSHGNKAVYDVAADVALITGNVKITRPDGTELTGDVGEVDFKTNQSRLLNQGHGRVRALLPPKTTDKDTPGPGTPGTSATTAKKAKQAPVPAPALAPSPDNGEITPETPSSIPATKFGS